MNKTLEPASAGLLALYGSVLLLALNGIFAKLIPLDATAVTQHRSVIASAFLFILLAVRKSPLRLGSLRDYVGVYALGILLGLHWITYFHAMKISSVAIGMLSLFSYPVITVLLEPMFKRSFPSLVDVIAAIVVFIGIFLMISENLLEGDFSDGAVVGAFWGLISALLFSVRNTAQKYMFPSLNSIQLMAHQGLAICILLLPFVEVRGLTALSVRDIGLLLLLGVFSTALAHTLLSKSLKHLSAKSVSLISCLVPVIGGVLAWLFLGEKPKLMVYFGGATILSIALYESLKQKNAAEKADVR